VQQERAKETDLSGIVAVVALVSTPTPPSLWELRGALLAAGVAPDEPPQPTLRAFYDFINEIASKATARQFSHFASLLDMAAVAGVAVQNLLTREGAREMWQRLVVGALSEGLMVLAARQYVRAWEEEMDAVYRATAWRLYDELWLLSRQLQPEQAARERQQLLERLLAPLRDDDFSGTAKAALIVRVYQVILLVRLGTGQD
jgi:hypothetical protein